MGDHASSNGGRGRWIVAAVLVLPLLGVTASDWVARAGAQAASPTGAGSSEIVALELGEAPPGVYLDILGSAPLVWTSYRDGAGNLVIELPNTSPSWSIVDLEPPEGLIRSVEVEREENGDRPLTRLVIATRDDAEHALSSQGNRLRVTLVPFEAPGTLVPEEPLRPAVEAPAPPVVAPEAEPGRPAPRTAVRPEVASPPVAPAGVGTSDRPVYGPPPSGAPATRLEAVTADTTPEGTEIRVVGDGEFYYSTFRLDGPDRFVLDLLGVVNAAPQATVPVYEGEVDRVRVAQFQARPELVSRVVMDLRRPVVPRIQRVADGLRVIFAKRGAVPEVTPPALPQAPAQPPTTVSQPPPMPVSQPQPTTVQEPTGASEPAVEPEAVSEPLSPVAQVAREVIEPPVESPPEVAAEPAPSEELAPAPVAEYEVAVQEIPAAEEVPPSTPSPAPREEPPTPVPVERPTVADRPRFEASEVRVETPSPAAAAAQSFETQPVGQGAKVYRGEPITFSLQDADIKEVLRSFAQLSGLNVVVQPGVTGSVTVELNNVPWDQALEQILKINGLGYELEGNIMRIAPITRLRQEAQEQQRLAQAQSLSIPLSTVIRRVSYAQARDLAAILRGQGGSSILSQRGSVIVDDRTNTLIIKELPSFMDTVIAVIENLDTPEPQVMIEARIVETTKRFTRSLGIDWSFTGLADAAHGNTTGLRFPNNATVVGGVELQTGARNGFLDVTLGNVLNTFVLDATLQAAETEGLINILSAPKVATLNNARASIQSGLQIPIQTVANNTVSVQFINATLRLQVTPHVTAEGTILMDINVQKRNPELAFAVVGATNAPINTREARTRVIVRDGGTTVIGGIYEVTTDQGEDRVPGLANIPIIKHLFKNRRRSDENRELLIFITPRVIKL